MFYFILDGGILLQIKMFLKIHRMRYAVVWEVGKSICKPRCSGIALQY